MTMKPSFNPSDVNPAGQLFPFQNTFGRVEREVAAACLVLAMIDNDDSWEPVTWPKLRKAVLKAIDAGELPWAGNPFVKPDFVDLEKAGFAVSSKGGLHIAGSSCTFTESGIEALASWSLADK